MHHGCARAHTKPHDYPPSALRDCSRMRALTNCWYNVDKPSRMTVHDASPQRFFLGIQLPTCTLTNFDYYNAGQRKVFRPPVSFNSQTILMYCLISPNFFQTAIPATCKTIEFITNRIVFIIILMVAFITFDRIKHGGV